jgi:alkaline phosphatase D
MNINEVTDLLKSADDCGHVVMMVGPHGIGKTEVVKSYAATANLHSEILMLSLLDTGDMLGLPYREGLSTKWAQPVWFTRILEAYANGQRSVLFLDEINRASNDLIGASLQLILDGRLNEHQLPPGTMIVAAINPDDGNYSVNSLDPAMMDRMVVCEVEADAQSWLRYAKANGVNDKVVEFITKSTKYIHHTPKDGGKGTSPRSWTRLSKYLNYCEENKQDLNTYYVKGTIGESLAAEFILFYNNFVKVLTVDDIITHYEKSSKRIKEVEKLGASMAKLIKPIEAVQRMDLADNLITHYTGNESNDDRMPLLTYLYALPIETLTGYLKQLKTSNLDEFNRIVALDSAVNNKALLHRATNTKIAK